MKEKNIAFIGGGNMGRAMLEGILMAQLAQPREVMISDRNAIALESLREDFGVHTTTDNRDAAAFADILILAVKPAQLESVARQIRSEINESVLVISIAAGASIAALEAMFAVDRLHVVRAMPNTPALAGWGMSALSAGSRVTDEEMSDALSLFESFGRAEIVPEPLMDAVTGLSGSSPAYVYMLIDAMADGAVAEGMQRDQALRFAAQTVAGAAVMVQKTGRHPDELKDAVCSPSGTTIAGVCMLEEKGFRSTVIAAVRVGAARSRELGGS